jgi:TPR repeat protein
MYCVNCGKEINDKAVVCVGCGVPVQHESADPNQKNDFLNSPADTDLPLIAAKQRCLYAAIGIAILIAPLAVVAMNTASVPLHVLTNIILFFRSIFSIYAILGLMRALSFKETTKTVLIIVACTHFIPAVIVMVILDSKARGRIRNAGCKNNGFFGVKIEPVPSFSGKDTRDVEIAAVLMVIYTAIILGPSAIEGFKEGFKEISEEIKQQEMSVQELAETGDAEAQAVLGLRYLNGVEGYPVNVPEAIKWLRKAVESGDPTAMAGLGLCYQNGTGVEQNHREAKKWMENSVAKGDALGQFLLGTWCLTGDNDAVSKDPNKAAELFRKSAEQECVSAMAHFGICLRDGIGIERDIEEAVKWLQKSVDQGDHLGQLALGACYYTGNGVNKDIKKAIELIGKSAAQGNQEAIDLLKKITD